MHVGWHRIGKPNRDAVHLTGHRRSPTLATANASGGTTVSQSPSSGPLALSSPAFADGAAIPTRFTCDGEGISPEVDWSGAPAATVALA